MMRAHDEAVRATLDWIEREHLQTRGYDPATGRRPREAADGMIAGDVSAHGQPQQRPAAPHACCGREHDAQQERRVAQRRADAAEAQPAPVRRMVPANDLARRLRELGHELVPTTVGGLPSFEIAGWSREWLDAFSTRRRDILRHMADEGLEYTTANAQAATLATRAGGGKKAEPVKGELVTLWRPPGGGARARRGPEGPVSEDADEDADVSAGGSLAGDAASRGTPERLPAH